MRVVTSESRPITLHRLRCGGGSDRTRAPGKRARRACHGRGNRRGAGAVILPHIFGPAYRDTYGVSTSWDEICAHTDLLISFGGMRRSADVPTLLMNDPGVSVGLALVHSMNPWQGDPYRAAMARARETSGKPLLVVTPGGMPATERETYTASGINVFTETDILLEGIGALMTLPPEAMPEALHAPARPLPARPLTEPESLRLLAEYGVRTVPTVECVSAADAIAVATRLGYPVVLKGVADGVAHKSDLGLVHVDLRNPDAVAQAFAAVNCPAVIVQPMIEGGLEAIAGVTRADGVGLVLIAGLGGIFAEALHDVTTFPLPVSRTFIETALSRGSLGRVLSSPRWKHPAALPAFIDLLMSLQEATRSLGNSLQAIDINPVILGAAGAVAVDALVVPAT